MLLGQSVYFPDRPGHWDQTIGAPAGSPITAIAGILRDTKVFHPPLGFEARLKQNGARLDLMFYYFVAGAKGAPAWGGEANTMAEFEWNDLSATLGQDYDLWAEGLPLPDGRRISILPRQTAEFGGFPLYDNRRLIVTRSKRPWWTPVTRQQYLLALIARREEQANETPAVRDPYTEWASHRQERRTQREAAYAALKQRSPEQAEQFRQKAEQMEAEIGSKLQAARTAQAGAATVNPMRQQAAALRQELAGLSPSARAGQAYWGGMNDTLSGLVAEGSPNSRPLVAVNPGFFDGSLPRGAMQILTVYFAWADPSREGPAAATHIGDRRLYEFLREADWKRLAAVLESDRSIQ